MENQNDINNAALEFDFKPTQENHSIIKVVGVGGGGSNAVEHMYETGIEDVSFLIINIISPNTAPSVTPTALAVRSSQSPLRVLVQYSCNSSMTPLMMIGAIQAQKNSFL